MEDQHKKPPEHPDLDNDEGTNDNYESLIHLVDVKEEEVASFSKAEISEVLELKKDPVLSKLWKDCVKKRLKMKSSKKKVTAECESKAPTQSKKLTYGDLYAIVEDAKRDHSNVSECKSKKKHDGHKVKKICKKLRKTTIRSSSDSIEVLQEYYKASRSYHKYSTPPESRSRRISRSSKRRSPDCRSSKKRSPDCRSCSHSPYPYRYEHYETSCRRDASRRMPSHSKSPKEYFLSSHMNKSYSKREDRPKKRKVVGRSRFDEKCKCCAVGKKFSVKESSYSKRRKRGISSRSSSLSSPSKSSSDYKSSNGERYAQRKSKPEKYPYKPYKKGCSSRLSNLCKSPGGNLPSSYKKTKPSNGQASKICKSELEKYSNKPFEKRCSSLSSSPCESSSNYIQRSHKLKSSNGESSKSCKSQPEKYFYKSHGKSSSCLSSPCKSPSGYMLSSHKKKSTDGERSQRCILTPENHCYKTYEEICRSSPCESPTDYIQHSHKLKSSNSKTSKCFESELAKYHYKPNENSCSSALSSPCKSPSDYIQQSHKLKSQSDYIQSSHKLKSSNGKSSKRSKLEPEKYCYKPYEKRCRSILSNSSESPSGYMHSNIEKKPSNGKTSKSELKKYRYKPYDKKCRQGTSRRRSRSSSSCLSLSDPIPSSHNIVSSFEERYKSKTKNTQLPIETGDLRSKINEIRKSLEEERREVVIVEAEPKKKETENKKVLLNNYYCSDCQLTLKSEATWNTHIMGRRHEKNLKSQMVNEVARGTLAITSTSPSVSDETPRFGFPPPGKIHVPSSEEPKLQRTIDECRKYPLVGLDYVKEIQAQFETTYYCALCDAPCSMHTIMPHLIGSKHQLQFLKEIDFEYYEMNKNQPKRREFDRELKRIMIRHEEQYGRRRIKVFKEQDKGCGSNAYGLIWRNDPIKKEEHVGKKNEITPKCLDTSKADFYCKICDSHMNHIGMWNAHVIGKRHITNMKKNPSDVKGKCIPASNIPSKLEKRIDNEARDKMIVGLGFIRETQNRNGNLYACFLCGGCFTDCDILAHLVMTKHKKKFLAKLEADGKNTAFNVIKGLDIQSDLFRESLIDEQCRIMVEKYGRGEVEVYVSKDT